VTYLAGSGHQLLGSCRDALRYYDATITLQPRHENAWLGRTMCLTATGETSAAIGAAATLIGFGSDAHMMDAFYWRAFNHHRLKDLATARSDIEESKRRGARPEIRTLAGIIEYEQGDLAEAQRDLDVARGMSERTCEAAWYLGLVHIKREAWVEAGGAFEAAMGCYLRNVTEAEAGLAALERRTDLDPGYRQQQVDGFRAAISEDRRQERAAAMNAATCFANAGVLAKIESLVSVAALDASLAPEISRLRQYLKERADVPGKTP
jgi:tetratricopeptide (TPR) repeat protein